MTIFLFLTCNKVQECGCSEGITVQGTGQRHEQGFPPRRVTDNRGGFGRLLPGGDGDVQKGASYHPRGPGEVESPDRDAAFSSACFSPGSQPALIARFPSRKRHRGSSWVLQMGWFCLSELCPLVSAKALDCFSSSVSPDQGFINTHLPLLLCHSRLEVMCTKAWHVNVSPGPAVLAGACRSLCLRGGAFLESFPPGTGAQGNTEK